MLGSALLCFSEINYSLVGSFQHIYCVDASTHTKNHLLGGGVAEHGWVSERRDTFRSQSSVRKNKKNFTQFHQKIHPPPPKHPFTMKEGEKRRRGKSRETRENRTVETEWMRERKDYIKRHNLHKLLGDVMDSCLCKPGDQLPESPTLFLVENFIRLFLQDAQSDDKRFCLKASPSVLKSLSGLHVSLGELLTHLRETTPEAEAVSPVSNALELSAESPPQTQQRNVISSSPTASEKAAPSAMVVEVIEPAVATPADLPLASALPEGDVALGGDSPRPAFEETKEEVEASPIVRGVLLEDQVEQDEASAEEDTQQAEKEEKEEEEQKDDASTPVEQVAKVEKEEEGDAVEAAQPLSPASEEIVVIRGLSAKEEEEEKQEAKEDETAGVEEKQEEKEEVDVPAAVQEEKVEVEATQPEEKEVVVATEMPAPKAEEEEKDGEEKEEEKEEEVVVAQAAPDTTEVPAPKADEEEKEEEEEEVVVATALPAAKPAPAAAVGTLGTLVVSPENMSLAVAPSAQELPVDALLSPVGSSPPLQGSVKETEVAAEKEQEKEKEKVVEKEAAKPEADTDKGKEKEKEKDEDEKRQDSSSNSEATLETSNNSAKDLRNASNRKKRNSRILEGTKERTNSGASSLGKSRGQDASDWEEVRAGDGTVFWYHKKKKEKVFSKPDEVTQSENKTTAADWCEVGGKEEGQVWYFNMKTGMKQWHKPEVLHNQKRSGDSTSSSSLNKDETKADDSKVSTPPAAGGGPSPTPVPATAPTGTPTAGAPKKLLVADGWTMYQPAEGPSFFMNPNGKAKQWAKPACVADELLRGTDWQEFDYQGAPYYVNERLEV